MFEFHAPPTIAYGKGCRYHIGEVARLLSISCALLVSDAFLTKSGVVNDIADSIRKLGILVVIFSDIASEPSTVEVENGLAVLRQNNCDGVICIGGGSAIDTAKTISVMATNPGTINDYMGYHKVLKPRLPLIAIPTTAGTGSETTRVVVITDAVNNVKMMCLDNAFMPDAALVDYELSISMPKNLTAYVGLDALTHSVEAYVSAKANPVSDAFALMAIELIGNNLLKAYEEPQNVEAREAMMLGANYAGIAFSNASVCTVHGMSRPLGAKFHIAHGLSNAMLLPLVTERSIEGAERRYANIAVRFGADPALSSKQLCYKTVEKLREFNKALCIPNLKAYGVDEIVYMELMGKMAIDAIASGSPGNNPRQFTHEEIVGIYKAAYDYN